MASPDKQSEYNVVEKTRKLFSKAQTSSIETSRLDIDTSILPGKLHSNSYSKNDSESYSRSDSRQGNKKEIIFHYRATMNML